MTCIFTDYSDNSEYKEVMYKGDLFVFLRLSSSTAWLFKARGL